MEEISRNFTGETDENHGNYYSGYSVFHPIFAAGIPEY